MNANNIYEFHLRAMTYRSFFKWKPYLRYCNCECEVQQNRKTSYIYITTENNKHNVNVGICTVKRKMKKILPLFTNLQ